jgi:chromosome segregation ATPase
MNDPLMIKLVEDIQHSGDPQAERQRILQRIRQEGTITRTLLIQLLGDDLDDESGGTGNKNPQSTSDDMADEGTKVIKFDEQELKSLEEDVDALSQFVDDFDQLDFQRASNLKAEIRQEVNNIQSELNDVHDQAELFTSLVEDMNDFTKGAKNKQDIIDEIENSYQHENKIREELKDIHNKMSEIRRKVKEVEDLCTQFNKVLGVSENEFSSTVDSITDDMHRMDSLIEHVNDYLQGHREGQGDEYIPDEVLGEAPR